MWEGETTDFLTEILIRDKKGLTTNGGGFNFAPSHSWLSNDRECPAASGLIVALSLLFIESYAIQVKDKSYGEDNNGGENCAGEFLHCLSHFWLNFGWSV